MLKLPGSKSIAQRALIIAAIGRKKQVFENIPDNGDLNELTKALKQKAHKVITFKENATGYRLFLGLCAGKNLKVKFKLGKKLKLRPHRELHEALKKIRSGETQISLRGDHSSQFASSVLIAFAAKNIKGKIKLTGQKVSNPYLELTKKMLKKLPKKIESDASSLAPFLAWSMIHKRKIRVENLPKNSAQADMKVIDFFKKLGAKTTHSSQTMTFLPPSQVNKTWGTINGRDFPDGVLSLMIFAPYLRQATSFTKIEHLKHKESDRLENMIENLQKCEVRVEKIKTGLKIFPSKVIPAKINPQNDHRIAMNFAVLGCEIKNKNCVRKSFPDFWKEMKKLDCEKIVLIGSRGTGKSAIGKLLSKQCGLPFYDLDNEIEKKAKGISDIRAGKITWNAFRTLEAEELKQTLKKMRGGVLATGGGAAEFRRSADLIRKNALVIYLYANTGAVTQRLANRKNVPQYKNTAKEDMARRHKIYSKISDLSLNTSRTSPETATAKILSLIA